MNETGESSHAAERNGSREPDDLEKLRRLLLAPEQKEIDELRLRLGEEAQTESLSEILPQAVRRSTARGGQLSQAITPAVESALKESVRRDPSVLTDAVFPIMGAAIRKAIAEAFEKMIQALNQTMEHSLSVKGLKWRMEAFRTGRSFAEVVLLRTLVYRVEQVFLIHKETGMVLQHVEAGNIMVRDTDMVSGMLTAIQDFARDSFRVSKNEGLENFQVGDLNVWIESSPYATLAAVIRGVAPQDFRGIMQDALQRISVEQGSALKAFDGDAAGFAAVRPILEHCLLSQKAEPASKRSPLLWPALFLLLALAAGGWMIWSRASERRAEAARQAAIEQQRMDDESAKHRAALAAQAAEMAANAAVETRWRECVDRIKALEGIVVIEGVRRDGRIYLSGLRDPLAADPHKLIADAGFDVGTLVEHWEPYYALSPGLVLQRATARLLPPASVRLRLQGDALIAEGSSRATWIAESRSRAESIPGVASYDIRGVLDESNVELIAKKKEIEDTTIIFGEGIQLDPEQVAAARRLARKIIELNVAASHAGRRAIVTLTGHTTDKGTELYNQKLGEQRAGQVLSLLTTNGVEAPMLVPMSVGPREPANPGATPEEDARNRRVTFRVAIEQATLNNPPPK